MSQPSVAIVGASNDRAKFGNKAVRAFQNQGFTVYPVNPKGGEIEGLPAYTSLSEIPAEKIDRISMYVPPAVGLKMLDEIAAIEFDELWLNPGSESDELIAAARERGLEVVVACSIVAVGESPSNYR